MGSDAPAEQSESEWGGLDSGPGEEEMGSDAPVSESGAAAAAEEEERRRERKERKRERRKKRRENAAVSDSDTLRLRSNADPL